MSIARIALFVLTCLSANTLAGQEYLVIDAIQYNGNDKTKDRILEIELDIHMGDTLYLADLDQRLNENKNRLLSTGLFVLADIEIVNWRTSSGFAMLSVTVQENWYIYPSVIFELADRNFKVWWSEQNRSLSRVNYGLRLDHINLTGQRDKLKLKFQRGYTPKYEVEYQFPYITKKWGASGHVFYSTNKEIGYKTFENKTLLQRAADERILLKRFRTGLGLNYRPSVYAFNEWKLEFHHNRVNELVPLTLNPDYFLDGKTSLKFFLLSYNFNYDKRIFSFYPMGGYSITGEIKKEGLGIFKEFNNLSISLGYEHHKSLSEKWIISGSIKGKTNLIRRQVAFANNTALGYEDDIIRGYELYVVDGTDWVLGKSAIKYKVYDKLNNMSRYMPIKQLKLMPTQVFIRAHLEAGYVNEPTYTESNTFTNRLLYGAGPAIDVLLWNTALISMEYSFNHVGNAGFYIALDVNF